MVCSYRCRRKNFNPRTPRGVRLLVGELAKLLKQFQSTHPARGATDMAKEICMLQRFQSTHPARGATISVFDFSAVQNVFQSTHPARGATGTTSARAGEGKISIHAPREGCDLSQAAEMAEPEDFNPRTPRGVRLDMYNFNTIFHGFQSTHPARGATVSIGFKFPMFRISIHAPREGCDRGRCAWCELCQDFNPRTPRGVRRPGF